MNSDVLLLCERAERSSAAVLENLAQSGPLLRGAASRGSLKVLRSMLGPAFRGLIQQRGRHEARTHMALGYSAVFDWRYQRTEPQLARLYEAAKASQWNASTDLDWSISVDPEDPGRPIVPDSFLPLAKYPGFQRLDAREKARQLLERQARRHGGRRLSHRVLERDHMLVAHVLAHDLREIAIGARVRERALRAVRVSASRIGAELDPGLLQLQPHVVLAHQKVHGTDPLTLGD